MRKAPHVLGGGTTLHHLTEAKSESEQKKARNRNTPIQISRNRNLNLISGNLTMISGNLEEKKSGNQIFSKFGLTVKTYTILVAISEGCSNSTILSSYVQGSMASITQKTKWLEDKDLIYRQMDKKDKRIWCFNLTGKGKEILNKIKLRGYVSYEALNFANGQRSIFDIAQAVSAEFGPVSVQDVENFFMVLEKAGLVRLKHI